MTSSASSTASSSTRTCVDASACWFRTLTSRKPLTRLCSCLQTTTDPEHPKDEPHQLKIEVPANRYDLLCIEGIARALKLYIEPERGVPTYSLKPAPAVSLVEELGRVYQDPVLMARHEQGQERTVHVKAETAQIRPYFASAILRNVKFDKLNYASFIDLQDKLHSNLARKRTLVAIGTHDLDKIAPGDISYEVSPSAPLNQVDRNAIGLTPAARDCPRRFRLRTSSSRP